MGMVILLIGATSILFFESEKRYMLSFQRVELAKYANVQIKRLKVLHHYFDKKLTYPRDPRFRSAIYDIEHKQIFSLLEQPGIHFDEEIYLKRGKIHFIKTLDEYYMGTKYLVIEIDDEGEWYGVVWKRIIGYGLLGLTLFMVFGYFLARRFVKPMRDSIMLLDRFIKDTTHELNTPLSAILANIEMMDTDVMVEKNRKKLSRINAAAITVSMLYKDLTYLTLEQEQKNENEEIDLPELMHERVEYFSVLSHSKELSFQLNLSPATIVMDRRKLIRVVDNLISNAIKYNKRHGTLGIDLTRGELCIWDTGIGISEENQEEMFDRYMRFEESEGGFGVGLSIVKNIIEEYEMEIGVDSIPGEGTRMVIRW